MGLLFYGAVVLYCAVLQKDVFMIDTIPVSYDSLRLGK